MRTGSLYTSSFNTQQFYVLPTQCIYVFCVDLRTNSDYFPIQHYLIGFYNREGVCLLRGTSWVTVIKVNCGEQSRSEAGFLRTLRLSPVGIIPPTLPTQLHLHVALTRRTNGRSLGTFRMSGSIGYKKYCSSFFKGLIRSTLLPEPF